MKEASLKKNFIFRSIFDIVSLILPIITTPYIARVLGPDGCGVYSYTQANTTYFVLFAVLGTYGYGVRTISRSRKDKREYSTLFWEIELLTVITSIISLLAFVVFCAFVKEYKSYYYILSIFIISALLDINWLYTGLERIGYITGVNLLVKVVGTAFLFVFVKSPEDLKVYFVINVLIQFFSNLTMWFFLRKFLVKVSIRDLKVLRHFKETIIYFIPTIAISIYTVLDKTLIGVITGEISQNGYYDKATQLINVVKTIVFSSMATIMGARTSYLFAEGKFQEVKDKIKFTMDYIFFLAIGCSFGILAISENFIPLFLGDRFVGAIPLLKLMTPLVLIVGISNCLGALYYTPVGKRKLSASFIISGAVTNLICNLILIPRLGAVGATIGTIIAESTISLLYLAFCDGYFSFKYFIQLIYKKAIAGVVMFLVVRTLVLANQNSYVITISQILLGVFIYISLLVLMRDSITLYVLNMLKKKIASFKHS